MNTLRSTLDPGSAAYRENRASMQGHLDRLGVLQAEAVAGGGDKYVARHRERGKLLPRERIELLLDRDAPFLEMSTVAAAGMDWVTGASLVTGFGVVSGVECVLIASDPTAKGGAVNPIGLEKGMRAYEIADRNRLPLIYLVESAGADLANQVDIFVPGGATFRNLTRLSSKGIPSISLVFGNSTAGGAYLPGMSDHVVMVQDRAKVFLAGPPLVKVATGEESTDEELGGGDMHAKVSGLADHLAVDELDAIRIGRRIVADLDWRKLGPGPTRAVEEPRYPVDQLLGIPSADLKVPFPIREVLARILDGSRFDEFKPRYGENLVTGWGHLHGYPLGVLANDRGVLFSAESQKAAQFIQLANRRDLPLLFIQNVTGYMVGKQYEQGGMIKHGSLMINAVSNSAVPHITLQVGGSYGAGNYGMCGRAYDPRFLFVWPNAKTAVMGPEQLAGTMSIVARAAAERAGTEFDEEVDAQRRAFIEAKIEMESKAEFTSARILDDGIIDPRDTRSVLGIALSAVHSNAVAGTDRFGVFRM
jgi:acetyl-CoA carboxylase carboxyltransferase component